jgi:hypothetical protein
MQIADWYKFQGKQFCKTPKLKIYMAFDPDFPQLVIHPTKGVM